MQNKIRNHNACAQLFIHLQAVEHMLKPRYAVRIIREPTHDPIDLKGREPHAFLIFDILDHGSALYNLEAWRQIIDTRPLEKEEKTIDDYIEALIKKIPAKYKETTHP
jgi:hypothetical protein